MSYFIVISGKNAALVEIIAGRLVSIFEAESYVAELASKIAAVDGSPSFFWDDSETGTSHELVCAAEEDVFEERPIEASALGHLIKSCELHRVAARVSRTSNEPDAFSRVAEVRSAAEALVLIQEQAGKGSGVGFVLHFN